MAKPATLDLVLTTRQSLHDLAQPLAALTGLVDLLLLETAADDPRLEDVRRISEQLEKVLEIVGEIRRMLREASGAEPIRRAPAAHPEP
jgi:signal transduction histidine kinase